MKKFLKCCFLLMTIIGIESSNKFVFAQCTPLIGAASYVVTAASGTGPGSLHSVITNINTAGVPANISFNISGSPAYVYLDFPLPFIYPRVYINGAHFLYGTNAIIRRHGTGSPFVFLDSRSCFVNLSFVGYTPVTYTITNTNDTGSGSLRQALSALNTSGEFGNIIFDIPGTAPHTISPLSSLPSIAHQITIDGSTQPANGYSGTCPKIILSGALITSGTPTGLDIGVAATNSALYGLEVRDFSTGIYIQGSNYTIGRNSEKNIIVGNSLYGIRIQSAHNGKIENNYIGLSCDGATVAGNYIGILLSQDNNTLVKNNSISGNISNGISTSISTNLTIKGNYIGTDATGTTQKGNGHTGIETLNSKLIIGGSSVGEGNVVSGNGTNGIMLTNGWCKIVGNKIGTDVTGLSAIPNNNGIFNNSGVKGLYIGGSSAGERNIISGNNNNGVFYRSGTDTLFIKGNYIGVASDGNTALRNKGEGVSVNDSAPVIVIGGATAQEGNVISGNQLHTGLAIKRGSSPSPANTVFDVRNNIIGLNASGNAALPNYTGVSIGNTYLPVTLRENIISGNTSNGIRIEGSWHVVKNNKIGTDASSTLNLGNGEAGVYLFSSQYVTVGGSLSSDANVIAHNGSYGIGMYASPSIPCRYNLLVRNIFYNNGNVGISHTIDPLDTPANGGYLRPELSSVSSVLIEGTAAPNAVIELYQNHTANSFVQGQSYVTSVTANASGYWSYSALSIPTPENIIALAYDPISNNTSEFSEVFSAPFRKGIHPEQVVESVLSSGCYVYPNPVEDVLTLYSDLFGSTTQTVSVRVYSSLGQEVYSGQEVSSEKRITIGHTATLPPGIYQLTVIDASGKISRSSFIKR